MLRKSIWKSDHPELFNQLVKDEVARLLRNIEDSKLELERQGVPKKNWVYLSANCSNMVSGNMLGCIFDNEESLKNSVESLLKAEVFHMIPEHGDFVSVVLDVRDKDDILFYLKDSLSEKDYHDMLSEYLK